MRKLIALSASVLMLALAALALSLTAAGPAGGDVGCGRDPATGRPVNCRCLPDGEPVAPRFWDVVGRQDAPRPKPVKR